MTNATTLVEAVATLTVTAGRLPPDASLSISLTGCAFHSLNLMIANRAGISCADLDSVDTPHRYVLDASPVRLDSLSDDPQLRIDWTSAGGAAAVLHVDVELALDDGDPAGTFVVHHRCEFDSGLPDLTVTMPRQAMTRPDGRV